MIPLLLAIHVLSAVFWVGGMAFAYLVLRPAAGTLDPAARLPLWRRVFQRFLPWVGVAILLLLITGFAMMGLIFGGAVPLYVHLMTGVGVLMMAIYLHLLFAPWQRFKKAVDGGDREKAAANLATIRMLVAANLVLGVLTIVIASTGRYW